MDVASSLALTFSLRMQSDLDFWSKSSNHFPILSANVRNWIHRSNYSEHYPKIISTQLLFPLSCTAEDVIRWILIKVVRLNEISEWGQFFIITLKGYVVSDSQRTGRQKSRTGTEAGQQSGDLRARKF